MIAKIAALSRFYMTTGVVLVWFCSLNATCLAAKERYVIGGGPPGGTFQVVATGIKLFRPIRRSTQYKVTAQPSAGSVENLKKVNAGLWPMGIVYSGHVYLGRNGQLKDDSHRYRQVLALAYLYGAPAQLVVHAASGIETVSDLAGKKVGVGNPGSGALANCELFFTHLGIWDRIQRHTVGYNSASRAFAKQQLDAFWLFTAFPSGAVLRASLSTEIALIDIDHAASATGFYAKYPYFEKLAIPAGTYRGVAYETPSFQDSTLWVAHSQMPSQIVYDLLKHIFSAKGLKHMRAQKITFSEMSVAKGVKGIVTPLHPGAIRYWREQGLAIPNTP
jgi:TRAP transporter TAXI family solute receptor